MAGDVGALPPLVFCPATAGRWDDLVTLFGERGACGGCWCMWWRLPYKQFLEGRGEANKRALGALVAAGEAPGILAYAGGKPVAWCSVAPRDAFPVLDRSRTMKRLDDQPVWSVVCFFVLRAFRRKGLMTLLLRAAVDYVRARGGKVVEGYPLKPSPGRGTASSYMGTTTAFLEAGFTEVARPSPSRSIVRYYI